MKMMNSEKVFYVDVTVDESDVVNISIGISEDVDVSVKDLVVYHTGSGGEIYKGEYSVTPSTQQQVLETKNKSMKDNVTVFEIPIYEVGNEFGTTMIIGG